MQTAQTNLIRKQFLISKSQIEKLDKLVKFSRAKGEKTSTAKMVRQAIDAYNPNIAVDIEAPELMKLVSSRLKEAVSDTRRTRKRLNKTLKKLGVEVD